MSEKIYHTHHKIPKHMNGTNDPENLVRLTVEEHAYAHRLLYEKYGKEEDRIAWLGLAGIFSKEEVVQAAQKLGRTAGGLANKGKAKSDQHKQNISNSIQTMYENTDLATKISEGMKGNVNSKNHSSEEYRKAQSERTKLAWKKRKELALLFQR